jgi:NADH-quinone oxidoreductase subunit J
MMEHVQQGIFLVMAALMLGSALGVVFARNQVYSAMWLVASFFFLASIYALLAAHTLAILQILVYAGAIVVLFLFVIMLLSIEDMPRIGLIAELSPMRVLAVLAAVALGVVLLGVNLSHPTGSPEMLSADYGTVASLGRLLYGKYLLPFEATSLLLLVAIVGAVVVAKGKI